MNKMTLICVPHPQGVVRTLRLARWHMTLCAVTLVVFLVSCSMLGWTIAKLVHQNRELSNLNSAYAKLRSDMDSQTKQIEEFAVEMDSLIQFEARIRDLTGLPQKKAASDETSQVGLGGQGGEEATENEETGGSGTSSLFDGSVGSGWTLSSLVREVQYRKETFTDLINHVTRQREQFAATPCIWPIEAPDAWISSGFGHRLDPISGRRQFHEGVDIVAPLRSPVVATADGKVELAAWDGGLGWLVIMDHGYGYRTRYAHNSKLLVKRGDTVRRGDVIALVGSTGRATGPHVHYEVMRYSKKVDPYRYLMN